MDERLNKLQRLVAEKPPVPKTEVQRQLGGPSSGLPPPYLVGSGVAPYLVVGIDFGSWFCRVATFHNGAPCPIRPNEFRALLEDVFGVPTDNSSLAYSLKYCLAEGRPVKVSKSISPGLMSMHSSVQVTAMFLARLKQTIQESTERLLAKAVISVPSNFTHRQRTDLIQAAANADIAVLGLVNDSTAAALNACQEHGLSNGRYLVICSGAHSFEVAVVHVQNRLIEMKVVKCDAQLAGHLITQALVTGVRSEMDVPYSARLNVAVDRAKQDIDKNGVAALDVSGRRFTFTREKARQWLVQQHLAIEEIIASLLNESNVNSDEISGVITAGAATKLWLLEELLAHRLPKARRYRADIAAGAATYAALLVRQAKDWVVWDLLATAVLVAQGSHMQRVLAANSPVPITGHIDLSTTDEGELTATILESAEANEGTPEAVATVTIAKPVQGPESESSIGLMISVSSSGLLSFSARDKILDVNLTVEVNQPHPNNPAVIELSLHENQPATISQSTATNSTAELTSDRVSSASKQESDLYATGLTVARYGHDWLVESVLEYSPASSAKIDAYDELLSVDGINVAQLEVPTQYRVPMQLLGPPGTFKQLIMRNATEMYACTVECKIPVAPILLETLQKDIAEATVDGDNRRLVSALLEYAFVRMTDPASYASAEKAIRRALELSTAHLEPSDVLHLRAHCDQCYLLIQQLRTENDPQTKLTEINRSFEGIVALVETANFTAGTAIKLLYDLSVRLVGLSRVSDPHEKIERLTALAHALAESRNIPTCAKERILAVRKMLLPDVHLDRSTDSPTEETSQAEQESGSGSHSEGTTPSDNDQENEPG